MSSNLEKQVRTALISVFYKDGLEEIMAALSALGVTIYSTGGTREFIEKAGHACIPVEDVTGFPSILGGRVKTLHPGVFGGILARRSNDQDMAEIAQYALPEMDLVIVDLYPFSETLASQQPEDPESRIIEKIDIGGPSMIRAAAKNFQDVLVVASKDDYSGLTNILREQEGRTSRDTRRSYAAKAFRIVAEYDHAIDQYFNSGSVLRYGENPHQQASFSGDLGKVFEQLNGKELSYNNLVDADAAVQLIREFDAEEAVFAIIKHTNVCGVASRGSVREAWDAALAGDPESAFGGVLVTNREVDEDTANAISEIFFEVLIAPSFSGGALDLLKSKKNRILLRDLQAPLVSSREKSLLNGILKQDEDKGNTAEWKESGGRESSQEERADLLFANIICKHLKSNAIALVRNGQLLGKGCGQTSRVDALRQAIAKARQSGFSLEGAALASDAFFPFGDCVQMAHEAGITAFIEPGGSIRDKESIDYCVANGLVLVLTGMRHFRH